MSVDLSIIIVSWNTRELLKKCLDSIYRYTRGVSFEVFLIDNGSSDKTVEMVAASEHNVTIIANKTNKGFAFANNQGIKKAMGKCIVLLNPDIELKEDSFSKMIRYMTYQRDCGICGCHLLNTDGSHQDSVRRFPRFMDQSFILLKLHHIFPHFPPLKRYYAADFNYQNSQSVPQVMGACFMITRELVEKIGLLDEKFFIWFEEVDYCKRAKKAGYKICYYANTHVIHHFGQSFKQMISVEKQKMWNKSLRYYFLKHHSFVAYVGISLLSSVGLGLTWAQSIYKKSLCSINVFTLFFL